MKGFDSLYWYWKDTLIYHACVIYWNTKLGLFLNTSIYDIIQVQNNQQSWTNHTLKTDH